VADGVGRYDKTSLQPRDSFSESGNEITEPFGLPRQEDVQIVELSFMSSEGDSGLPPENTVASQQASEAAKFEEELGLGTPNSQIQTSTTPAVEVSRPFAWIINRVT
jgi:hypothetical protein